MMSLPLVPLVVRREEGEPGSAGAMLCWLRKARSSRERQTSGMRRTD